MDRDREAIVRRTDLVAELAQRVQEGGLGPVMHPGTSFQSINSMSQADQRAEKTRGRAGIADKERQRGASRSGIGNGAPAPFNGNQAIRGFLGIALDLAGETQLPQSLDH